MNILYEYPPNWTEIKQVLPVQVPTFFCYGDTIYSPHVKEVPEDIIYHEAVHANQQRQYPSPDIWWTKYLYDKNFRKNQELEAYSAQYLWLKEHAGGKVAKLALEEMADGLASPLYQLQVTKHQAETMIRKFVV